MLRVSVLELPARWGRPLEALRDVEALLADTDLAILPELALTGYVSPRGDFDLTRFAEPIDGPTMRAAAELARDRAVHLVVPLVLASEGNSYNAAFVVGPDGIVAQYKKRHPWFPEQWATPGQDPYPRFEMGGLGVTLAICYDGHFLAQDASEVLDEADLLVFMSAWVDEEDSRLPLLRTLARNFDIAVANANWAPGAVVVPGQGGSCILDRRGRILASVPPGERRADALLR